MKTKILSILIGLMFCNMAWAQVPNLLNYQGVARNAVGNVLPNKQISLRLSVRSGSNTGPVLYSEIRRVTTNVVGMFNLQIGSPGGLNTTGNFGTIDWLNGQKYLTVEVDENAAFNFVPAGDTRLGSVPYAMAAGAALPSGPAGGVLSGTFPNPTIANGAITAGMLAAGTIPAPQTLTLTGNTLGISGGNTVTLPAPAAPTLTLNGNTLGISGGNSVTLPAGSDNQQLSLNGNQLSITNGNTVTLPAGGGSQTLSVSGNDISISGGNTVPLPTPTLSISGNQLSIANGNTVTLPSGGGGGSQTLSVAGNQLSISGGNTVTLPSGGGSYAAGTGINIAGSTINNTITSTGDLSDVTLAGNAVGKVLKWNGTQWAPADDNTGGGGGGAGDNWGSQVVVANANELSGNGTAATPLRIKPGTNVNDYLKWDGTDWVSAAAPAGGAGDNWGTQTVVSNANEFVGNGTAATPLKLKPGTVVGQVIKWDGTNWVPGTDQTGGGGGGGLNAVAVTPRLTGDGTAGSPLDIAAQGAAAGQVLKFDGTKWAPAADLTGGGGGGSVSGNGTTDYVARWTPNGTTLGNSAIQDDGRNTAIGASPSSFAKLNIAQGAPTASQIALAASTAGAMSWG